MKLRPRAEGDIIFSTEEAAAQETLAVYSEDGSFVVFSFVSGLGAARLSLRLTTDEADRLIKETKKVIRAIRGQK